MNLMPDIGLCSWCWDVLCYGLNCVSNFMMKFLPPHNMTLFVDKVFIEISKLNLSHEACSNLDGNGDPMINVLKAWSCVWEYWEVMET